MAALPECRPSGSVRGVPSNGYPYRNLLSQCRGKFGFPITDGLMAEDEPADQEHFGQIP